MRINYFKSIWRGSQIAEVHINGLATGLQSLDSPFSLPAHQIGSLDFFLCSQCQSSWCRAQNGHNFEEKHCRRCSNHCSKHNFEGRRCSLTTSFLGVNKHCCHYLVPSNRNQTTPISLVFCGCSLVIEGEPNRALCRLVAGGG
ncbi:uncharacterized protein LOC133727826 isoform X2 [Rosa rugosa]|uniref:uncharacterized protein LOC133727826 isoform X2 n=1 Tax=Rosa rugosa TaxID=74645 RepID=UPI002B40DF12|nr:uncharacterized protein LOC133727826 isoform X2 [Rosa rugosa]